MLHILPGKEKVEPVEGSGGKNKKDLHVRVDISY